MWTYLLPWEHDCLKVAKFPFVPSFLELIKPSSSTSLEKLYEKKEVGQLERTFRQIN